MAGMTDSDIDDFNAEHARLETNCNQLHMTRKTPEYKISIRGISHNVHFDQVRKLLFNTLDLRPSKITPARGVNFAIFKTSEEREEAIKAIDGFKWRNFTLRAEISKAHKRKMRNPPEGDPEHLAKTSKLLSVKEICDMVKDKVIPLWKMSYEDQLKQKYSGITTFHEKLWKEIKQVNPGMIDTVKDGCRLEKIVPSPVLHSYRNKCEFSIEYREDFFVGFTYGSRKEENLRIGPVKHLPHIPDIMKAAAGRFEDFLNVNSDRIIMETNWRHLTVRTTIKGELMVMPVIQQRLQSDEDIEKLKQILKDEFHNMKDFHIDSFYLKVANFTSPDLSPEPYLIFGDSVITEEILGLKFQISPDAFFQTNVKAAEVLYSTLIQEADVDENTTVIDVCCGTGTIGLCLAQKAGEVIGVESVASAVRDAKTNAKLNDLEKKCSFVNGPAELFLSLLVKRAKHSKITAIVDPPRAGLNQKGIAALRNCQAIKRLVYVSCDPNLALSNFVSLTRPISKEYNGNRFIPKKLIPIDLFPSTDHVELVVVFERD